MSQIGPNRLKPILLHGTSFAHFVGSVRVVDFEPQARLRLTWGYHSVRQLTSGSSFAHFVGSVRVVGFEPQTRLRLTWGHHSLRELRWLGVWFRVLFASSIKRLFSSYESSGSALF